MSKFLGFLLGIIVALAGPAAFGVLTADGGIELNAKEMALAYGIGALIFWAVVSYFSGAAALGAALTFGAMIYAVHWIPNRTTNFLNDVPGVTTGMIDGIKAYTLNGVVPILAVISLVYAVQLIVQSVRRRRRERAEAERRQREQEIAQAQQEAEVAAVYAPPVAAAEYAPAAENRFQNFGNTSYDDLFEDEPAPVQPRSQADEHTMQFAEPDARAERAEPENTAVVGAVGNDAGQTVPGTPEQAEAQQVEAQAVDPDETQVVAAGESGRADETQVVAVGDYPRTDEAQGVGTGENLPADETQFAAAGESPRADETQVVGAGENPRADETQVVAADSDATQQVQVPVDRDATQQVPVAQAPEAVEDDEDDEPPVAPTAGATAVGLTAGAGGPVGGGSPQAAAPQPEAPQPEAPQAQAPQAEVPQADEPKAQDPKADAPPAEAPRAEPPKNHGQQSFVRPKEEVGQQYRERMDDPEDTGEFFVGQFRPAGA
ncbi:hypothetical protein [Kribbella sp. DT2]|uniref:hypothetical protein n=1 Tax=Kribbella sp. DT2 TaxID=3393427 RepID=UPI003CF765CA